MKTRKWFYVLSVLLLAALLCMLGPAALAEGPDSESAFRADLARLGAHADELAAMREDALINYLNCIFDAEAADDPAVQERLLGEAELCWTLYADLLSVQSRAELAACEAFEEDPYCAGAQADPFQSEAGQRREGRDEFYYDGGWPFGADFRPEQNFLPHGYDAADDFGGCPFSGAHGSWQYGWAPAWGYWDDDFDDYGDFWPYYSDDDFERYDHGRAQSDPAEAFALDEPSVVLADAEAPVESFEPMEPDIAAQPAEISGESDEYVDWAELEELFMQALLEALFGDEAQEYLSMPNPWTDAAAPDEAAAVSGLLLDVPEALPREMELQLYRAMDGTAEADYSDGSEELTLRASLDLAGLALTGDYNDYSAQWQEKVGDLVIDCLGDGEKINAAAWSIDGVNYSLVMAPGKEGQGLSYDEISAITAAVKAVPVQTGEKTEPSAELAAPSEEPLEMPFALPEETMVSEADAAAAEVAQTNPNPVRLIVGGGDMFVCIG